ncbi:MFS general substrate transporter [Serendipita vermifera]|nr:MFS general substrate transporter [Serendipita vermifera]
MNSPLQQGKRDTEGSISAHSRPFGLEFRSSVPFCTFIVFLSIFVDLLVYSIIIPVIPFRLEELGYNAPSALTGWLLVAYSLGLVIVTPPIAFLAERYWSRRTPLLVAIVLLIGSQAMFMEARTYWFMVLSRVLQGISSAAVWVVSFALLCDTVPEKRIGQYLGIVMTGSVLGFLIGPPLGGVLHAKLGYRAPYIFCIVLCILDLIGRILVIERETAEKWTHSQPSASTDEQQPPKADIEKNLKQNGMRSTRRRSRSHLPVIKVIITLGRSKRAFIAFFNTFLYGIVFTLMEPTLPLRLQEVYGFPSLKVGIIYFAVVIPSLISTPLAGWISDKVGVNWVTVGSLVLSIPWWILMALPGNLAMLLASLALAEFFLAAVVTPLIADLAASAKELDGIGYAHVFGAFNFAYSCASALGPLIGGYIYSEVKNGWTVMVCFSAALTAIASVAAIFGSGEIPLSTQFLAWIQKTPLLPSNTSITRSTDIFPVISSSKTADGQSITPGQQPSIDAKGTNHGDDDENYDTLERLAEAGERYLATPSGSDYYFDTVTTVRGDHSTRASVLTMSNALTPTPDNHTDKNRSSESKQSSCSEKSSIDKKHDILEVPR